MLCWSLSTGSCLLQKPPTPWFHPHAPSIHHPQTNVKPTSAYSRSMLVTQSLNPPSTSAARALNSSGRGTNPSSSPSPSRTNSTDSSGAVDVGAAATELLLLVLLPVFACSSLLLTACCSCRWCCAAAASAAGGWAGPPESCLTRTDLPIDFWPPRSCPAAAVAGGCVAASSSRTDATRQVCSASEMKKSTRRTWESRRRCSARRAAAMV